MDIVMLSRLQFAAATMFHFLFVPLTLGLSVLIAVFETKYARTGDKLYLSMVKFWGKLFLINFVLGIVTGITLEFQFGTNWSRYSAFVGDIFGSILAIEASAAFFLESTFIGVWIFGWKKLSPKAHAAVMWLIACASTLSAVWIIIANAWMQHPVGFVLKNSRAELNDFSAVVFHKFAVLQFLHVISAAYIITAFFVMGICAYHILKNQNSDLFSKSFRTALVLGLVFSVFIVLQGDFHASDVSKIQPTKLAAMEALWKTTRKAPVYLFALPDEKNEKNVIQIGRIPGLLSLLAYRDINSEVKGLKDFPKEERPPVLITSMSFKVMVGLGFYFIFITIYGWIIRKRFAENKLYLKIMLFSIPLPYIATELGWIMAEVGRQPWIVYGLMKTSDAVSPLASLQVFTSLIAFILVYGLLGIVGFYLIIKNAKKNPEL